MMKSWALNQIIALNHHNESLDLGPKSTLSLQRSESPRNPTSMAGPTSHRRRDWLVTAVLDFLVFDWQLIVDRGSFPLLLSWLELICNIRCEN